MKNRIKELRLKTGLTLRALGEKVGLSNNTLSQYETGKREPRFETWKRLADFFGVSVPYLLGFDDDCDCNSTIKADKDVIDRLTAINVDYLRELDWLVSRYPMARFELQWLENEYNLKHGYAHQFWTDEELNKECESQKDEGNGNE